MKVYIVIGHPFPSGIAANSRVICYAKGLESAGLEVEILVHSFLGYDVLKKDTPWTGIEEGIKYRYCNPPYFTNPSFFNKLWNHFNWQGLLGISSYICSNACPEDVVILYHPSVSCNLYILKKVKKLGIKVFKELNEIPGYGKKDITNRFRAYFQPKMVFKRLDGILTISSTLDNLAKIYNSKTLKVPILIDLAKYPILQTNNNINIKPYIFHAGSHFEAKDGFLGMLKVIGILKQKGYSIDFYSTGYAHVDDDISQTIDKFNIKDNVHFLGYVSDSVIKRYQRDSLLFIINKYDNEQNRYCFATKLGEYLATGRPVITTKVGEAALYLENEVNAYVVPAGDYKEIASIVMKLYENPGLSAKVGRAGRACAERYFDYRIHGKRIAKFLRNYEII